jgi:hypothetical protein
MAIVGINLFMFAAAPFAWAESQVKSPSGSATIEGDFRASMIHRDNGLAKTTDTTPDAEDSFGVREADLHFNGAIDSKTLYMFEFSLVGADYNSKNASQIANPSSGVTPWDVLKQAHVTHQVGPISWRLGRQFVNQGGWDFRRQTHSAHGWGNYTGHLPFGRYEDALTLMADGVGEWSVQLLNDLITSDVDSGATWNQKKHPTFVAAYRGQFGAIEPLVQFGTMDNQKSNWLDLGVRASVSGLVATLDYSRVSWGVKTTDVDDEVKSEDQIATSITLNVVFEIRGTATPYLYLSSFDKKQSPEDAKVNTRGFDDNAFNWSIGADIDAIGSEHFKPFFTITSNSGEFEDIDGKVEVKSEMNIEMGAWANL